MTKLLSVLPVVLAIVLVLGAGIGIERMNAKQPTLRDKLSQPIPMVSSMEVVGYHDGVYVLANVNGDEQDMGNYALGGTYKLGDVVTVLWATEDSTEIAGEVLVGTADELDLPHGKN
ncbi:hypothetical protein [Bacillus cereus]